MKRKSPQEKKATSLKKDRRNTFGENSKASRVGITRKKRRQNRAERRLANKALSPISGGVDLERIDKAEGRLKKKRLSAWRLKFPDEPLGEVVARKLERRARLGMVNPETAAKKARKARRGVPKQR